MNTKSLLLQPPVCENGVNLVRRKRQVIELSDEDSAYDLIEREETIKVSVYLSIYNYLSIYPSICLSIYPSIYLSIYMSIY